MEHEMRTSCRVDTSYRSGDPKRPQQTRLGPRFRDLSGQHPGRHAQVARPTNLVALLLLF